MNRIEMLLERIPFRNRPKYCMNFKALSRPSALSRNFINFSIALEDYWIFYVVGTLWFG